MNFVRVFKAGYTKYHPQKIDKLDSIKVKNFCLPEFITKSFGKQQNSRTYLQYIRQRILAYCLCWQLFFI